MDFTPLPPGLGASAIDDIASAIADGFPARDRDHARAVLVASVLPWDLRGIASFADPRRLIETAYASLVVALREVPPDERLAELDAQARRRYSQHLLDRAVALAVARWANDHAATVVPAPWKAAADGFRGLDRGGLAEEAARQRVAVEELEAASSPRARRLMHPYLPLARLTLRVAETGTYVAAAGPLLVFLRQMGATARDVTLELQRPRTERMASLRRAVEVPPPGVRRR